jgi:two-component system NtrC family sensor kinase
MPNRALPQAPYYRSLVRNMVASIIVVSFIPVFLVSLTIYYQFQRFYRGKTDAHLLELVEKQKQRIDDFLTTRLADIRFLAESNDYESLSNETVLQERLMRLQRVYKPVFVDLGVINAQGRQVSYAGPFKLGQADYSEAAWFKTVLNRHYVISDVFLGLRGLPHFIVAVRREINGRPWVLRATVDFVAFNDLVENIRVGETGYAFIVNAEGAFQTKPRYDITPVPGCYAGYLDCSQADAKNIHIGERRDEDGGTSIYVTALLKDRDWLLVYRQNTADAFSDLKRAEKISLIIFILGGLGIIVMALLLSLRMVNRIVCADKEKAMMNRQVIETGKMASLGELATGVAHEINNPVAIMVEAAGWIDDLLKEGGFHQGETLEEIKETLKLIHVQGQRCKDITQKLLSFGRGTDSRTQPLQLNDVISEVLDLSAQRAKFANVELRRNLQADLPKVTASETEMHQVFLNLINNAVFAMEKTGGTIEIATALSEGHILIEVADTGPGIPKGILDRIFDPFFTTKPVGQGTGLGLSICYGIISKMNGQIDVGSEVGKGTTFRIRLPVGNVMD